MSFALFLGLRPAAGRAPAKPGNGEHEHARVRGLVARLPGCRYAAFFAPAAARDPLLDDGMAPAPMLELVFATLPELESALSPGSPLAQLPGPEQLQITQQAMSHRMFPVPDPVRRKIAGEASCSYLVTYPGPAEDLTAFVHFYVAHHVRLMQRFPGIRAIEVCTRVDWASGLGWAREDAMLRNRVLFDSASALTAALASPVRAQMRAEFQRFPPFEGGATHYPMRTLELLGAPALDQDPAR